MHDLIVIGGGPAGYRSAERAAKEGLDTLLIEQGELGGVCLTEGCIPTKTMLYSAKLKDGALYGEKYGVKAPGAVLNHAAVLASKKRVVAALTSGLVQQLKSAGVQILKDSALITGRGSGGFEVLSSGELHTARHLLIATGSVPVIPPIQGAEEALQSGYCLTSKAALELEQVPDRLCIIGGGAVGLELASYFHSAGSKVTVIEMLSAIGGGIDTQIAAVLKKNMEKKGVCFIMQSRVTRIAKEGVVFENESGIGRADADKVFLLTGRRAMTKGLGLQSIGVRTEQGAIVTDEHLCTNVPGVYAAGDVNAKYMLAHTAYREAEAAVNHMLGKKDAVSYRAIPVVLYTNPEVAVVGETPDSAAQKGMDIRVRTLSLRYSGRYMAENHGGDGVAKMVIDNRTGAIIGFHMIGSYASEIIYGACMMIELKMTLKSIRECVFPHPTVCEIIRDACY